jgi:hypothetical protein
MAKLSLAPHMPKMMTDATNPGARVLICHMVWPGATLTAS